MRTIQNFKFNYQGIGDLCLIEPFYTEDNRGYFTKSFEKDIFENNNIKFETNETFESYSVKNVLRGLHFQSGNPQAKLVYAVCGEIFDVAVDIRKDSDTFGEWRGFYLGNKNNNLIYIPPGFAHGFLVLSDFAIVSYQCSGKFIKEYDSGIIWNDKDVNIDWPISDYNNIILSERDNSFIGLKEQFIN